MNATETGDRFDDAKARFGLTDDQTDLLRKFGLAFVQATDGAVLLIDAARFPDGFPMPSSLLH